MEYGGVPPPAQEAATSLAFPFCAPYSRVRRELSLNGAQAAFRLLKQEPHDSHMSKSKINQVPLVSSKIVEPDPLAPTVNMLEALPPEEAAFYAREENVREMVGYSVTLKEEIKAQYCFLRESTANGPSASTKTIYPETCGASRPQKKS